MESAKPRTLEPHFEPVSTTVLVRTPLLPAAFARRCFEATLHSCSDDGSEAHLPDGLPVEADPAIYEALAVASPDLVGALSRPGDAQQSTRRQRAAGSLARYLVRMATRPTPFGLCAGVALGSISARTDLALASRRRYRKRARPDMGWLLQMVESLESQSEIAK